MEVLAPPCISPATKLKEASYVPDKPPEPASVQYRFTYFVVLIPDVARAGC